MFKLTKEEFDKLYSEDTTRGEYKSLREKAKERMDYVRDFLQENYVDSSYFQLDYDNSQNIRLEHSDRDYADGFFDPEEYTSNVIFGDANNTEEGLYPNKFSLIIIQNYRIIVNTKILYTDFEQEILDWIRTNGNVADLKRSTEKVLAAAYRQDYNYIMDLLGPHYKNFVKVVDINDWQVMKDYLKSLDRLQTVS